MSVPPARIIRGQPPSPPRSEGHPTPEPHREPCGVIHPLYAHHDLLGAGMDISRADSNHMVYDNRTPQPVAFESSSSSRFLPNNYISHPLGTHTMQVNTPPSTSDDSHASEPMSSAWQSAVQKANRPKARASRSAGNGRRPGRLPGAAGPPVPGPLSELTKHLTHVPIRDMESWVHRPIEVRRQEVARKDGKVARPMNSFMLYRSAYTERTKKWLGQNNHQVVSVAVGRSWRMEPPEIRDKFEILANIEKKNHVKAHPGYRFSPKKDHRRGDDRRSSRLGNTPDSSPGMGQTPRTMSTSEIESGWGSRDSTPLGLGDHGLPTGGYLSSSWQTTNPGRPAPGMMPPSPPEPTQYLQQSIHQSLMGSHVEDVRFNRVDMQDLQYSSSTALAGLPGAAHHELLQPPTSVAGQGSGAEGQLDPQLLGFQSNNSSNNGSNQAYGSTHYPPVWHEHHTNNNYVVGSSLPPTTVAYQNATAYPAGMQQILDGREGWDTNHDGNLDASGTEFEHWINSHPSGY
ncbi:hypothetical protein BDV25DRAFT_166828 [Aspergillus avenaceus]|uniref:HMG box domain-containing protein n=1 Tax=Aspergillus avenaceus TaxID=36643 RepID=A0A5N6TDS4_ASPAV|nr:hypothetical protein BDV25DRAFT_166828 [Aspergillus avenaceus]